MTDGQEWQVAAVRQREIERRRRADKRACCIARFIERQRAKRQWISLFEIADVYGLSAGPAGSPAYRQTHDFALCALSRSILDGKFERAGWSRVLYLPADVMGDDASPQRWLKREPYRIALDAEALKWENTAPEGAAPELPLDVLGCCWLSRDLARQWIEAHGSRWPLWIDLGKPLDLERVAIPENDTQKPRQPGVRTTKDMKAEAAALIFIAGLKQRPANKEEAFTKAKKAVAHIGQLSGKAFERAWAGAVPEEWSRGGRRPKAR